MELDFQERLDKHLKSIESLSKFSVEEQPFPDFKEQHAAVNTINNHLSFASNYHPIKTTNSELRNFFEEVIKQPNGKIQNQIIQKVYDKI